jgi:NAD(P)-dependent dehydrogenase (short-subunit alcohol dehydrogenase family)
MSQPRIFVTGATGFLGLELAARLLARSAHLFLLLRPDRTGARSARVERLSRLAREHGGALSIVHGDVATPDLGAPELDPSTLAHAFHVAGYYDLAGDPERLERVNVDGTRHVLDWLGRGGFRGVLHHVSSIAVAGDHEGTFTESMLEAKQGHPTEYQRTKYEAERLVRAETRFPWRVYRPGAIVGHSKSGEIDRIDGPYFLFRAIHAAREALPRWASLPGWDAGRVHMVPVDFVADAIDAIAHREGLDGQTFHVTDPEPPKFRRTFNLIADAAGAPRMGSFRVDRLANWLPGGRNVVGQLGSLKFFREQYLASLGVPPAAAQAQNVKLELDTANLRAALEGTSIACPKQDEYVEALWDFYLRKLDPRRDPEARDRKALAGKVVLVTGASSGIGEAIARYFAKLGCTVVLVARREPELQRVAADIGPSASYVVADLAEHEGCDRAVRVALERHGRVDVLVNNAGRSIRRPLAESLDRFHDLERVMQINFFGPARLIRAVLPGMRERKSGIVVNVLSAGAMMASPRFGAYTASKAALGQLSDTLAAEHLHEGIRVVNAYLSWVRTPMMDATGKYEETRAMTPDEAARWIARGIAEGTQHVLSSDVRRRFTFARLRPETVTRALNVLYRIYADDPAQHPELALDRAILERFVDGPLL